MKRTVKKILINIVIIVIILIGAVWLLSLTFPMAGKVYTNNAQVRQDIVPVNARVQGFVKKVYVGEFQKVRKGDTLFTIEDSPYRLRVAQAQSSLTASQVGTRVSGSSVASVSNNESVSNAALEEVRVRMENARREYLRYSNLYDKGAVTKEQLDDRKTSYDALNAQYKAMDSQSHGARLETGVAKERLSQSEAAEAVARAQLDIALLDLSYTVVLSPCDGYTSRKLVSEGELVQPGTTLQKIVDTEETWILANFRETQMDGISIGDEASVTVDAVPGVKFEGKVTAISQATGGMYSPVPTDNSAGNFVKVEGRVPVKIELSGASVDGSMENLRDGLNAIVRIRRTK